MHHARTLDIDALRMAAYSQRMAGKKRARRMGSKAMGEVVYVRCDRELRALLDKVEAGLEDGEKLSVWIRRAIREAAEKRLASP
jgi:hypothetical protein